MFIESRLKGDAPLPGYLVILWAEFEKRHQRNPRYSLRSFSKQLGLNYGHTSRIFARKRAIRLSTAQKLVERLQLPDDEKIRFLESIRIKP